MFFVQEQSCWILALLLQVAVAPNAAIPRCPRTARWSRKPTVIVMPVSVSSKPPEALQYDIRFAVRASLLGVDCDVL